MTLERRTPLRAKPRGKGNAGELEVIDMLRRRGWRHARRNFQSGGQGGGDILEGPADTHLEVKRRERVCVFDWMNQAESEARPTDLPVVIFRRNRSKWYAMVDADELLALIALRERA